MDEEKPLTVGELKRALAAFDDDLPVFLDITTQFYYGAAISVAQGETFKKEDKPIPAVIIEGR